MSAPLALAWSAALALLGGCAPTLAVRIVSNQTTNDGRPLYFMARNADADQFLGEDYTAAAERLFKYPADPLIAERETIFPGRHTAITLEAQADKDVILYFFFTRPGAHWKVPLHHPLPSDVVIELGRTQIKRVMVGKR